MTRTTESYFADWERSAFGFGYGTGEQYTIPAIRDFLALREGKYGSYDYEQLEDALTPTVAWLMINALNHAGVITYGTSPRYGSLGPHGIILRDYVISKNVDELYDAVMHREDMDYGCSPESCNCGPNGYDDGAVCPNPFWPVKRKPGKRYATY